MPDDVQIGYIRTRLMSVLFQSADTLLFTATNPWELDEAAVSGGFRMGPCEMQDLLGLDTVKRERAEIGLGQPADVILTRMIQEGRLGKKVSVGWYRYPGGGGRVIDPLIEDLVREESYFAKIERSEISDAEIFKALRQSLANEAKVLAKRMGISQDQIIAIVSNDLGLVGKLI